MYWQTDRDRAIRPSAPGFARVSFGQEWEELARHQAAPPFMRPGWFAAWQRAFGRGALELVSSRAPGGELTGVVPVTRRGGVVSGLANWHSPGFGALAVDRDAAAALAQNLLSSRYRRLDLMMLDPHDALGDELARHNSRGGPAVLRRVVARSPYIEISGSFEEFESSLRAKRRKELRRQWRRLNEAGEVAVEVSDGRADLERTLAEGLELEASGWKGENGTAVASRPETAAFYTEIARWAAEQGWLRLCLLRLDGRPIAFNFGLAHDGALYALKGGFDEDFSRHAPGMLLDWQLVAHCHEHGFRRFELLGQDDPYKLEWTTRKRLLERVQVFAPTTAGALSRARWTYGRSLARRIHPRLGGQG